MKQANMLSALGRVSYTTHLALYPLIGGSLYFIKNTYSAKAKITNDEAFAKSMPKAKAVDPDDFNPFTIIPFHNNPELRYRYANYKMHNYLNKDTQMNEGDYTFRGFHDSYDHGNKMAYLYNWVSDFPRHNA